MKSGDFNISRCTRHVEISNLDIKTGGSFFGALSFKLSDLPDYSEFSVFDEYRIKAVKVYFTTGQNVSYTYWNTTGATADSKGMPMLLTCIDNDDAVVPTYNAVLEHNTCRFHGNMATTRIRSCQPKVATEVYQAVTSGYTPKANQWINTASSGVPHYGIKFALFNAPQVTSGNLFIHACYYLEFRKTI